MRRLTISILSVLLLVSQNTNAQLAPRASQFGIETSRVFIQGQQRQGFWTVQNKSLDPFFAIAEIFEVTPTQQIGAKSQRFLASPARGLIKPLEHKTLRLVRLDDALSQTQETLSVIRLKMIPSTKGTNRLQSMSTVYVKLFYRPESLVRENAIGQALTQLSYEQRGRSLVIHNPSPYWLTLSSLIVNGRAVHADSKKAWMIAPQARLTVPMKATVKTVEARAILENGISSMLHPLASGRAS